MSHHIEGPRGWDDGTPDVPSPTKPERPHYLIVECKSLDDLAKLRRLFIRDMPQLGHIPIRSDRTHFLGGHDSNYGVVSQAYRYAVTGRMTDG